MNIIALHNRLQKFDSAKAIDNAIDATVNDLVELNRDRMAEGLRSNGVVMPYYSTASVVKFGKEPGPILLLDTGSFQQNIVVKRDGDVIDTFSRDSKNDMLVEIYDEKIFGTGGNYKKQYIRENLRPALRVEIKIGTGL